MLPSIQRETSRSSCKTTTTRQIDLNMSTATLPQLADIKLPRRERVNGNTAIAGPSHAAFTSRFGNAFPEPHLLESDLGITAVYELPPPSGQSKRRVLIIHGLNTPALGMLALARGLQALDRNTHIVLYDLWGHGLSSTPLIAHTPHIFHSQIYQVLGHMQWTNAHLIGYSFGGPTVTKFALYNPRLVSSVTLLGSAGLMRRKAYSEEMLELLNSKGNREAEAAKCVLDWLEGGPLVVPADWKERSKDGKAVAEALREWELQEHAGYPYTLLSVFRDGGVTGGEEHFRKLAQLPVRTLAIVAELDPVCSRDQFVDLGFKDVEEIKDAHHDFVRTRADEVADLVNKFWQNNC